MTTYTDASDLVKKAYQPLEIVPPAEKSTRFVRIFLTVLIALTLLAFGMAALKIFYLR